MSKGRKSIFSSIFALFVVFSFALIGVSASETAVYGKNSPIYYEYLSEETGKTEYELKVLEKEYGDLGEYFNIQLPGDVLEANTEYLNATEITKPIELTNDQIVLEKNKIVKDPSTLPGYYEGFAEFTGLSVEELKEIHKNYGELSEHFDVEVDFNRLEKMDKDEISINSDGTPSEKMSKAQFDSLKAKLDKGDIVISKDQWFTFVNHGHAAIAVQTNTATKYIVQHTGSGKSKKSNFDDYASLYSVRLYYTNTLTGTKRSAAADYAAKSLLNYSYDALADINSSTYVNCATLVWKALKNQGVKHETRYIAISQYYIVETVWPKDFVTDNKTTLWAQVNWSGDGNKW